jgi:hypothetical protein
MPEADASADAGPWLDGMTGDASDASDAPDQGEAGSSIEPDR